MVDIFERREPDWPEPMGIPDDRLDVCDPLSIEQYLVDVTIPAIAARNAISMELRVGSSALAAASVADGSADVVFIDAGHEYTDVYADITAWYPKLKTAGLIAGHDYEPEWPGVVRAVDALLPHRRILAGATIWYVRSKQVSRRAGASADSGLRHRLRVQ
jgi:hypothetical protein